MDREYFNIGIASDIVGIAPETLRHYERKNILTPSVQDKNGYRQYKMSDICILGRARAYRQFGFSLEESQRMITERDIAYTTTKLQERATELEVKIFKEIAILNSLKQKIEDIQDVQENHGKMLIRNRPEILAVHTFTNGIPDVKSIKSAQVSKWYGNQASTFPCWTFSAEKFMNLDVEGFEIYMGIKKSDVAIADLPYNNDNTVLLPSCTCLLTSTISPIGEDRRIALAPVVEYLRKHKMRVCGEVVWQTVFGHAYDNDYMYYRNLWVPII